MPLDPIANLPAGATRIANGFPDVWKSYAGLGEACAEAGPVDERTRRLIKLALALAAGSEGATHSHARRALAEGIEPAALRHVAVLAIPTLGLPAAVKGLTWIDDVADEAGS